MSGWWAVQSQGQNLLVVQGVEPLVEGFKVELAVNEPKMKVVPIRDEKHPADGPRRVLPEIGVIWCFASCPEMHHPYFNRRLRVHKSAKSSLFTLAWLHAGKSVWHVRHAVHEAIAGMLVYSPECTCLLLTRSGHAPTGAQTALWD